MKKISSIPTRWAGRLLLLLGLSGLFVACSQEIGYEFDYVGDQIVVQAVIDPARGLEVFVSRSVPPGAYIAVADVVLTDAIVTLRTSAGDTFLVDPRGGGHYALSAGRIPDFDQDFQLSVQHAGLPTATSEWVRIPAALLAPEMSVELVPAPNDPSAVNPRHFFRAGDPAGPSFYLIEAFPANDPTHQFQRTLATPIDSEICGFNYSYFPDACFADQSFFFELTPDFQRGVNQPGGPHYFTRYVVAVRSISVVYYDHLLDRQNLDDPETSTVVEARPSSSNIEGGLGVFLSANSWQREYDRP